MKKYFIFMLDKPDEFNQMNVPSLPIDINLKNHFQTNSLNLIFAIEDKICKKF